MARREFRGTSAVPVDLTIVSRPSLDVDVVGARNHFFGTRTNGLTRAWWTIDTECSRRQPGALPGQDRDERAGIRPVRVVPSRGLDRISKAPPRASSRSAMP
jgi:hypothetical protein